jgi:arylsulfatase A-like enzyme
MRPSRIALSLFWPALLAQCGTEREPPPPCAGADVLLITLDTTRKDHLGCYGWSSARTPNIDRLAHDGLLFENAFSAAPITLPSHTTIFTSTYPMVHGVRDNGAFQVPADLPTLATVLHDAGYRAGAFVSSVVLDSEFGLDRGFDLYQDEMMETGRAERERPAEQTASAAITWLRTLNAQDRFFAWVHFFDAHRPWDPPAPFREQFAELRYDGEIAYVDQEIGRLLAALAELKRDRLLVVLTADHGEGLGDHNEQSHGIALYDATLQVPLIVRPPHAQGGTRIPGYARTLDIAPTILFGLGVRRPDTMQGENLWPRLLGTTHEEPAPAYLETHAPLYVHGWPPIRGLVVGRYKLIEDVQPQLFDLSADPGELQDLAAARPDVVRSLEARLNDLVANATAHVAPPMSLSSQMRAQLTALGYADGATTPRPGGTGQISTQERLRVIERRSQANELYRRGVAALGERRADQAIEAFSQALELASDYLAACGLKVYANEWLGSVYAMRARAYSMQNRAGDEGADRARAIDALTRCLAEAPHRLEARLNLATCQLRAGNTEQYEQNLLAAIATQEQDARAHAWLAGLRAQQGRLEEALASAERAVARAKGQPEAEAQWRQLADQIRAQMKRDRP